MGSTRGAKKGTGLFSWADPAVLTGLLIAWAVYVGPIVVHEQRRGGDIFRDVATAVNIQHGQLWADPAYPGETFWYPPLSPMIMAAAASTFDITPADAFRWSQLFVNWLIPAGLYIVVRLAWNRRTALAAMVALLLAMPWWQTEVIQGQPSVHAVIGAWGILLLYGQQHRRQSVTWAGACGLVLGIAFWHHPLIPGVLTLAVAGAAVVEYAGLLRSAAERQAVTRLLRRNAVLLTTAIVVAGPAMYAMLRGPVLNPVPRTFLDPLMFTAEFALLGLNPWIWITGLLGLYAACRQRSAADRLLICALAVCVVGQLPGYLRHFGPAWAKSIPVIVPHEFQWTFQIGWAIGVGIGIDRLINWLAPRLSARRRPDIVHALTALAVVLTGAWGVGDIDRNLRKLVHRYAENFPEATAWIRAHTEINDVFACEVDWAFAWLNPDTGRKVWITSPGHSNPRVDWTQRKRVLDELAGADSPRTFWELARRCGIDYCIASPGWAPRVLTDPALGPQTVPAYLAPVFVNERIHILQVVDEPGG